MEPAGALAGVILRVVDDVGPEATLAAGVPLVFGESDPTVEDLDVRISMSWSVRGVRDRRVRREKTPFLASHWK